MRSAGGAGSTLASTQSPLELATEPTVLKATAKKPVNSKKRKLDFTEGMLSIYDINNIL